MLTTKNPYVLGTWGHDVSSRRVDELDVDCIRFALDSGPHNVSGIDIGCGLGTASSALAFLGVRMDLIDVLPLNQRFDAIRTQLPQRNLTFRSIDARNLTSADLQGPYRFLYSRRFIHYLTYAQAESLVTLVAQHLEKDGRAFVSTSGIHSELRLGYADAEQSVERRHGFLSDEMRNKHNIEERVCLYSEGEFASLFERSGFHTLNVWSSEFGNVQGLFCRSDD